MTKFCYAIAFYCKGGIDGMAVSKNTQRDKTGVQARRVSFKLVFLAFPFS
jgi:hypothetical protein